MADYYKIDPVGIIRKQDNTVTIEVHKGYEDALLGLDQFSHIIVFSWFHKNDFPEKRGILQVHPRGNKENPLTGVFATRSPLRPNPIAISTCKILSIDVKIIHIDEIDAFDGTPVIDIKPCISRLDLISDVRVPDWAK